MTMRFLIKTWRADAFSARTEHPLQWLRRCKAFAYVLRLTLLRLIAKVRTALSPLGVSAKRRSTHPLSAPLPRERMARSHK